MTVHVPDRFKAANAFWIGLGKIGLTPAAVLSQARLPLTVYDGKYADLPTHTSFTVFRISSGGQIAHFFRLKLRRHAGKNLQAPHVLSQIHSQRRAWAGPSCQTWLLATLQVWDYLLGVTVNSLRFFTGVSKRDGTRVLAGNLERTHPFDFNFASFAAMNARMSSDIPNSLSHCSL